MKKAVSVGVILLIIDILVVVILGYSGMGKLFELSYNIAARENRDDKAALYLRFSEKTDKNSLVIVGGFLSSLSADKICLWSFSGFRCFFLSEKTKYTRQIFCDKTVLDRYGVVIPLPEEVGSSEWESSLKRGDIVSLTAKPEGNLMKVLYVFAEDRNYLGNCNQ